MSLAIVRVEERLYTFEQATELLGIPPHLLEWLLAQGLVEAESSYLTP